VAYHFIFSFFAGFFFLACLATQFGRSQENVAWILDLLRNFLPLQGIRLAEENIGRFLAPVSQKALPFALLLSLWTASNVVEAVMKALNRIYHVVETRPLWQTRIGSLLLVVLTAAFFVVAFNLTVFGDEVQRVMAFAFRSKASLTSLMAALQWPLVIAASGAAALLIYFLAPNFRGVRRRIALPGAVFFALSWQAANNLFDSYVRHFADFDRIYGPLGTAMAVLLWVYVSSLLLLIGGEINAHVYRHSPRKRKAAEPSFTPSEESLASTKGGISLD
jgi:membrane protein